MVDRSEELTQASAPARPAEGSYMDWPAIFAGAVIASAIAFVFSTFGAALGLSLISPFENGGSGGTFAVIAVGLWMLWTTASSFMAGGYVAGRMRRRMDTASADEVGVRDGVHGLTVWGVGTLIGAVLLSSAIGSTARVASTAAETATDVAGTAVSATADAAGTVANTATNVVGEVASAAGSAAAQLLPADLKANPLEYAADTMFRTDGQPPSSRDIRLREEARTILASILDDGDLEQEDRDYLVRVVTQQTELSQQEVEARVDQAIQRVQNMREQAVQAAEQARQAAEQAAQTAQQEATAALEAAQETAQAAKQYSVISAFALAAALFLAAAGAYWAAGVGGRHRDEGKAFAMFGTWH